MGERLVIFLVSHIAVNGWWFCATQTAVPLRTPLILIPIIATVGLMIYGLDWLIDNWDS